MDFVCIDVETANEWPGSICQIGVATFRDSLHQPHLDIDWLVRPESDFRREYTWLHGIDAARVQNAPLFADIYLELQSHLGIGPVLSHGIFDQNSVRAAAVRAGFPAIIAPWLNTMRVARHAWPGQGFSLSELAHHHGIAFSRGHSALPDAVACGEVFLKASAFVGFDLGEWLSLMEASKPAPHINRQEGDPHGHLTGEVVVFTGDMALSRKEMTQVALRAGCRVDAGVTKHTTILVLGVQDPSALRGKDMSTKHQRALDHHAKGKPVRILSEADFVDLVKDRSQNLNRMF